MPTLNQIRLTNIKYNADKRIVQDELLNIQGENTLSLLQNTGGKSVLTKFMLQPIMWEYDRFPRQGKTEYFDMRKFFKSNTEPCYVLEELKLEGNEGFLLLGVGIEKGTKEGRLKKLAFMHHYTSQDNKYSLKNFPLFTKKGNDVILCGLDTLSNNLKEQVTCFKSDNYEHKKLFRQKLLEYHINIKEFEKIHSRIINVEGGIAEVFTDSGTETTKDLLIDWILPAIEGKISDDEDDMTQIGKICNNIKEYVESKIANQEDQKKLDELRGFMCELDVLYEQVHNKELLLTDFNIAKANLISMYTDMNTINEQMEIDVADYNECIDEARREIEQYRYEKLSFTIVSMIEQLNEKAAELLKLNNQEADLDEKKSMLTHLLNVQEACGIYSEMQELENSIQRKKDLLKPVAEKVLEYELKTKNIKYTLKYICERELEKFHEEVLKSDENISIILEEINQLNGAIDRLTKDSKDLKTWIDTHNKEIILFEIQRDDFNTKYPDLAVEMNRRNEFELMQIQRTLEELAGKVESDKLAQTSNANDITLIKQGLKDIEAEIRTNTESKFKEENDLRAAEQKLEEFYSKRNNIVSNLLSYRFKEQDINRKEYVASYLSNMKVEKEDEVHKLMSEIDDLETRIGFFKNDKISINHQLEKQLKRSNIDITFGFEYLKKSPLSIAQKEVMLRNNPLIPYSIIVTQKDYEKAKTILETSYTFNVIPLLIKEHLEQYSINRENSLFEVSEHIGLLGGYNEQIVTEDYMIQQVKQLEEDILKLKDKISIKKDEIKRLDYVLHILNSYEYTSESERELLEQVETIKKTLEQVSNKIVLLEGERDSKEKNLSEKEAKVELLKRNVEVSSDRLNELTKLFEHVISYFEVKEEADVKSKNIKALEEEINSSKERLNNKKIEKQDIVRAINYTKSRITQFKDDNTDFLGYDEDGELVVDTKGITLSRKALIDSLNHYQNAKEFNDVSVIKKDIEEFEGRYASKRDDFNVYNITIDEVRETTFERALIAQYKEQIETVNTDKNTLSLKKGELISVNDKLNNEILKLKRICIESYQKDYNPTAESADYDSQIKIKDLEISEYAEELAKTTDVIRIIANRLPKLAKYKDMEMPGDVTLETLTVDNMETLHDKYESQYSSLWFKINTAQNEIEKILNNCEAEYVKRLENKTVQEFLQRASQLTGELVLAGKQQIENLIYVLQVGEDNLERQFKAIMGTTLDYTEKVHQELRKVDKNSYLESLDLKLFELAHIAKEGLEDRLSTYLLEIVNTVVDGIKTDSYIDKTITTYNLLDYYIGLDSVQAYAIKINAFDTPKVRFEDTHKNGECSGAQRTIIGFAILKCIMYYTNEGVIENNRDTTSFMFLDNPFGVMSSENVIKPFYDIAKQFKTTLYSWTALEVPAVIKMHKNMYSFNIKSVGHKEYVDVVNRTDANPVEVINTSYLRQSSEQLDIEALLNS